MFYEILAFSCFFGVCPYSDEEMTEYLTCASKLVHGPNTDKVVQIPLYDTG